MLLYTADSVTTQLELWIPIIHEMTIVG